MKRIKFSESQIIKVLKEYESGQEVKDLCREYGVSKATFYNWKKKYSGMDSHQLRKFTIWIYE